MEGEDFENIYNEGGTEEDNKFDTFVGCLQEIVLDDTFTMMQDKFCKENCNHFDNTEENKLIYMTIFKKWQQTVEHYVEDELQSMIPGFNMDDYVTLLKDRRDEIDEQLFDLLESFSEFLSFKELMLSHRKMEIACTPKHKSAKAAALEQELLEKSNLEIMDGFEMLSIGGSGPMKV